MHILKAVFKDFIIYFNLKTKQGRRHLLALLLIGVGTLFVIRFFSAPSEEPEQTITTPAEVSVRSIGELAATASFDTVGKVEAISEANLQTEAGGRVTSVNVSVGDTVRAGTVLATIENATQRAALLQAEGSYEAALAAANQSTIGIDEAETTVTNAKQGLINAQQSAYNLAYATIVNNIDLFFVTPESSLPGLRLAGGSRTDWFNNERVAFQTLLPAWQARSNQLTLESDLEANANYAVDNLNRTIAFVDAFLTEFPEQDGSRYSNAEIETFTSSFTSLRASLITARGAIQSAKAAVEQAEDAFTRAHLSATGGGASAADAQVKIALGALQAAKANYQKTIVSAPISGVVNAFYLKAGDFVSPNQPAAIVANNNGLQIKTFVSEADGVNLSVGDTVTIEGGASGVITAKAEAIDPTTGKVAVVVGVDSDSELTNGATVKLTFSQISTTETAERVLVPLSALKITPDGTFVFTVNEQSALVAVPVVQGQLYGENIELTEGVSADTRIVIDARGLKAGQVVTIK